MTLAWAGTAAGASAIVPAVQRLLDARRDAYFILLQPSQLQPMSKLDLLVRHVIRYPVARADATSLRRSVAALRAANGRADGDIAVVFTEPGWSADVPAYIAYLAGIRARYGFEAEFGGGLLSHRAAEPTIDGAARHLRLLEVHGLLKEPDAACEDADVTGRG